MTDYSIDRAMVYTTGPFSTAPGRQYDVFEMLYRAVSQCGYMGSKSDFEAEVRSRLKGDDGYPGPMGMRGKDGYNPYEKLPTELDIRCVWKGIRFDVPVPKDLKEELPSGELYLADLNFIKLAYGEEIFEKYMIFWEREYRKSETLKLFFGEEEWKAKNPLQSTVESKSSEVPSKDSSVPLLVRLRRRLGTLKSSWAGVRLS